MTHCYSYNSEELYGTVYEFTHAGDRIPRHNHRLHGDVHNVVCLRGEVAVQGPDISLHLGAGDIADFDGMLDHEIVALVPDSKIVTFYLHGRPKTFAEGYVGEI